MTKPLRLILLLVMAAAILFMAVGLMNYIKMKTDLSGLQNQLVLSRQAWETTADEKVELQGILKGKKEELKEAELTLSEATERAETLRAEIEQLNKEIDSLKENLKSYQ